MNLKEQRRKLILFLVFCLCILLLFIFIIAKSSPSSATEEVEDHEHTFSKWYLYESSSETQKHYRECTYPGCSEMEIEDCSTNYFKLSDYKEKLSSLNIQFGEEMLDNQHCYKLCDVCKNSFHGEFIHIPVEHDFSITIAEKDMTEDEKPNYVPIATCIQPANVLKKCSYCGIKTWEAIGRADPDNHDFTKYRSTASYHWKVCSRCGRADSTLNNGVIFSPHEWGEPIVETIPGLSYYDIATVDVKKYTCSTCGRTKEEAVNPKNRCPSKLAVRGYHHWLPGSHDDNFAYYYCEYCGTSAYCTWERRKLGRSTKLYIW